MIEREERNEFKVVIIEKLLWWQGALAHLQWNEEIQNASTGTKQRERIRPVPVRSRIAILIRTRHETQRIVILFRVEGKTTPIVAVGTLR